MYKNNRQTEKPAHVIIIGASGHARVIADIIRCSDDIVDGFLDDREPDQFPGLKLLGKINDAITLAKQNQSLKFVIGIGQNSTREAIRNKVGELQYYTAIHPSAVIAADCAIGAGTAIMANAVINTGSRIGKHCIINTAATVDHDCELADFVHISPGAHICGTVGIGQRTWIGAGACLINNINVCSGCVIGVGSVVIKNIDVAGKYVGAPARIVTKR